VIGCDVNSRVIRAFRVAQRVALVVAAIAVADAARFRIDVRRAMVR
jgi:hypothetical protein